MLPEIANVKAVFILHDIFQSSPKSYPIFRLLWLENLIPRPFKNSSIWSHCIEHFLLLPNAAAAEVTSVTRKNLPNVFKSCPKMISLEI